MGDKDRGTTGFQPGESEKYGLLTIAPNLRFFDEHPTAWKAVVHSLPNVRRPGRPSYLRLCSEPDGVRDSLNRISVQDGSPIVVGRFSEDYHATDPPGPPSGGDTLQAAPGRTGRHDDRNELDDELA